MRYDWLVVAVAAATLMLASPQAKSTNYPWCGYSGEVGTPVCAYMTFEQCRMSARSCIENGYNAGRSDTKSKAKKAKGTRVAG